MRHYSRSAQVHDLIYAKWDYRGEVKEISRLHRRFCSSEGRELLDVACGTGEHASLLRRRFRILGIDASGEMLREARKKSPGVEFRRGNMERLALRRRFDVIICLGSAIGYVRTMNRLRRTLRRFAEHLKPGGIVLIVPWIHPQDWIDGHAHIDVGGDAAAKVVRAGQGRRKRRLTAFEMHHLVVRGDRVEHFVEHHVLGLFTKAEYESAFRAAGLQLRFRRRGIGPASRGCFLGMKPLRKGQAQRG